MFGAVNLEPDLYQGAWSHRGSPVLWQGLKEHSVPIYLPLYASHMPKQ